MAAEEPGENLTRNREQQHHRPALHCSYVQKLKKKKELPQRNYYNKRLFVFKRKQTKSMDQDKDLAAGVFPSICMAEAKTDEISGAEGGDD